MNDYINEEYGEYMDDYEETNIAGQMDFARLALDIDHVSCIISAVRRSGKTHLLQRILYEMAPIAKWDLVILYSETCLYQSDEFDYVADKCKISRYDPEHLANIMKQQGDNILEYKTKMKKGIRTKRPPRILILLDDVIGQENVSNDKSIANLYVLGRHLWMSVIFLTQHLNILKPKIRRNADILIIFKDPNKENRKIICNTFMSLCNDDEKYIGHYVDNIFNEPYKCAVVCVYKSQFAKSLEEYVYEYKAPEEKPPPFRIGNKKFWEKDHNFKKNDKLTSVEQNKRGLEVPEKDIQKFMKKMQKENNHM